MTGKPKTPKTKRPPRKPRTKRPKREPEETADMKLARELAYALLTGEDHE